MKTYVVTGGAGFIGSALVRGLLQLGDGEVVVIDNEPTFNQAWALLQQIEGVRIKAKYAPSLSGDVRDSQADITQAREHLGYNPTTSFEEGLRRTLEWHRRLETR